MTPARRRQRPDWDDNLTVHATPQRQAGDFDRGGGFSPRPTARELLQEALARIQTVASPRPQHAKRQRRAAASQPEETGQQPATAVHEAPQLQPAAIQEAGHSCGVHKTDSATAEAAWRRQQYPVQAAARQGLVKRHAFGGKPTWVQKPAKEQDGGNGDPAEKHGGSAHPAVHPGNVLLPCLDNDFCTHILVWHWQLYWFTLLPVLTAAYAGPKLIFICNARIQSNDDMSPEIVPAWHNTKYRVG